MGDWAEWVQWADWVDAVTQTQLHFTSSFKDFQCVGKWKVFFPFGATSVARKSTFPFSDVTDWLIAVMKMEKSFFCATLVANKRKQSTFCFFNTLKSLNEEVKWSCICVIAFTQLAHCTHSAQSPIYGEVGHGAAVAPHRARNQLERYSILLTNFENEKKFAQENK